MWFQTLKTRQTIKKITCSNCNGQLAALEYSDKKVDVHMLKRESSPLSLDEGTVVAFLTLEDGCMFAIAVTTCTRGSRPVLEFRLWDIMSALGFTSRDIVVQDMEGQWNNEGKLKAIVNLPESMNASTCTIKVDSVMDYLAVSAGPGSVLIWKSKKAENLSLSLELITTIKSSITIHDIALIYPSNDVKSGVPSVIVGGSGGVQIFNASKQEGNVNSEEKKFNSVLQYFPSGDHFVQEIQRSSLSTCILSDNSGSLWLLTPSKLTQIHLPSSINGHGVFGVQMNSKAVPQGWMATVQKNQTVNLYKLDDVLKMTNAAGLIVQPCHVIFSSCQLNCISFIDANTLVAGSPTNRTLSLWAGLDCLVK